MAHYITSDILKGRVVIVGVGNVLRGDDAFGPALVDELRGRVKAACIDAGTAPENYLGKIAEKRPDTVIIADAVHMKAESGKYCVLEKGEIVRSGFTTHDLSPVTFIEYLENETGADIYVLAVQPEKLDFGAEMSKSVRGALSEISGLIKELIHA